MNQHEHEITWAFGTGYLTQPAHKRNKVPEEYLAAFLNTRSDSYDAVAAFCKDYGFDPEWITEGYNLVEGFQKIHKKFAPIVEKVLVGEEITYTAMKTINAQLQRTHPKLTPRRPVEALGREGPKTTLWKLTSDSDERPVVRVTPFGHPEVKKGAYVEVTVTPPENSTSKWGLVRIGHGIAEIMEEFPSKHWSSLGEYKSELSLDLNRTSCRLSPTRGVARLTMTLVFDGANKVSVNDLAAKMTTKTPLDQLCFLLWSLIKSESRKGYFKSCTVCGDVYRGRSNVYCGKAECKKEALARSQSIRYKNNPDLRRAKIRKAQERRR